MDGYRPQQYQYRSFWCRAQSQVAVGSSAIAERYGHMLLVLSCSLGSVTGNASAINLDAEDPVFESGLGRVAFAPVSQW